MPLLALPLALIGLASLPALGAIYWLRNRYQRREVSSLVLWLDHTEAREGGRRIERLQTPLLFFLELIALALLALAAADPRLLNDETRRPLVVILDDSYSMQATDGDGRSVRDRAIEMLRDNLTSSDISSMRLIVAGVTPQVVGGQDIFDELEEHWHCQSPTADLSRAISMAGELSRGALRVQVVSDRPPPEELTQGRLRWWSLGTASPNVAIVNAARSPFDTNTDRILLEVMNLSDQRVGTTLTIDGEPRRLTLQPLENHQLWVKTNKTREPIEATLSSDSLAIDNHVTLQPVSQKPLRVQVDLADEYLRKYVSEALDATRLVKRVTYKPSLLITDSPNILPGDQQTWLLRFDTTAPSQAWVGPFVLDRAHPLCEGLSMTGVVWSAPGESDDPGRPIIAAGNVSLASVTERAAGRYDIRIRLQAEQSTLQQTPNFPILLWNAIDWRLSHRPGVRAPNARLGLPLHIAVANEVEAVQITSPMEDRFTLPTHDFQATWTASQVGTWQVKPIATETTEELQSHFISVNALSQDESDLQACAAGRFGTWINEESIEREYRGIAWIALLVVLGALLWHAYLIAQKRGGA